MLVEVGNCDKVDTFGRLARKVGHADGTFDSCQTVREQDLKYVVCEVEKAK